ncbi:NADPH-dependent FMN reductase [Weissella confusa]|uniref:NADPH-dependent FMN reductase n=1 Tax=Weissella confusa TaxID=1583 RepID=UPI00352364AB
MNLVAIVGTNARKSYNRSLLWFMKKHFKDQANIEIAEIAGLPLFSEEAEVPLRVEEMARQIEAADGVIISTPEYDHSITASLKSVIEWMSYGSLHPFTNMPVMIVGTSLGKMGTTNAQEHLRQIMDAPGLDAFVLPGNQFLLGPAAANIDVAHEELTNTGTVGFLEQIFSNFMVFADSLRPMRAIAMNRATSSTPKISNEDKVANINLGYSDTVNVLQGSALDLDSVPSIVISPAGNAKVLDRGDGWWIEKTQLTDKGVTPKVAATTTTDDEEDDATTGASMF